MKNSKTLLSSFLLSIFFIITLYLVSSFANENEKDKIFCLANTLIEQEKYDNAITELKRYLFLFENENNSYLINQKISYCYLKLNEEENALKYIDNAIYSTSNDSVKSRISLNKVILLLYFNKYNEAMHIATREHYFSINDSQECQTALLLLLSYILSANFNQANTFVDSNQDLQLNCDQFGIVSRELQKQDFKVFKNPKLARNLSTFLPGLGQVYSGNFLQGLNAFVINAGLIAWFSINLINADYFNSFLSLAVFQNFYRGNRTRAYKMAIDYNNNTENFYISEIIDLL